jgi:hypothetical protein
MATIKSNLSWASMALTLAASGPPTQGPALQLLANMSADAECCRTLREKTNSIKILSALLQSLEDDVFASCQLVLQNLKCVDSSDPSSGKRISFREARPSSSIFAIRNTGDGPEIGHVFGDSPHTAPPAHQHRASPDLSKTSSEEKESLVGLNLDASNPPAPRPDSQFAESPQISDRTAHSSSPRDQSARQTASSGGNASPLQPTPQGPASPSVPPFAPSTHAPVNHRDSIAQELLLTETAYVATLNAILSALVPPYLFCHFLSVLLMFSTSFVFWVRHFFVAASAKRGYPDACPE